MRRAAAVVEDSPAGIRVEAGSREVAADSQAGAGNREVAADNPAAEDTPAAGGDSPADIQVEAGSREAAVDSPAAAGIPAAEGNPVAADSREGNPAAVDIRVAEDSPAAVEDSILSAEACRRMSCRTWRKKYCRDLPECRNWDRLSATVYRRRYRTSVREHCWRRIAGILSIAA
jgi:hypothetical protein